MPDVLTDAEVCRILGREKIDRLQLVLIGDELYERSGDGRWYKLGSEPAA